MSRGDFKFSLGASVAIKSSGEAGTVIGRSDYLDGGIQIQVHYVDNNGCSKTEWIYEALLISN